MQVVRFFERVTDISIDGFGADAVQPRDRTVYTLVAAQFDFSEKHYRVDDKVEAFELCGNAAIDNELFRFEP